MENGGELFPRFYKIPFGKGLLYLSESRGDMDPAMAGIMTFGYWESGKCGQNFGSVHPDEPTKFILQVK